MFQSWADQQACTNNYSLGWMSNDYHWLFTNVLKNKLIHKNSDLMKDAQTSKTGEFRKYSCIIFACSQRRKENIKDTTLTTSKQNVVNRVSIIYWWLLWGFPRKIRSLFPPDTSRTLATLLLRCLCVIPTSPLWPLIRSTLPQKQRSNLLWGPSLSPAMQQTSGPPLLLHNFQSYWKGQRKAGIKHPKVTLNHAGLSQPDMSTMRWREMKQQHRGMGLGPAPRELFVSRAPWEKDPGQTLEATAGPDCGRVGVKQQLLNKSRHEGVDDKQQDWDDVKWRGRRTC